MPLSRRFFLESAAGAVSVAASGSLLLKTARAEAHTLLEARTGTAQLAPAGYPETGIRGFGEQVPGPVIQIAQGSGFSRECP